MLKFFLKYHIGDSVAFKLKFDYKIYTGEIGVNDSNNIIISTDRYIYEKRDIEHIKLIK